MTPLAPHPHSRRGSPFLATYGLNRPRPSLPRTGGLVSSVASSVVSPRGPTRRATRASRCQRCWVLLPARRTKALECARSSDYFKFVRREDTKIAWVVRENENFTRRVRRTTPRAPWTTVIGLRCGCGVWGQGSARPSLTHAPPAERYKLSIFYAIYKEHRP